MKFYHYTCLHGAERIEADRGLIKPNPQPVLGDLELSWFTTLPSATRAALGLSSRTLSCDRMGALFEVEARFERLILPWHEVKAQEGFVPLADAARRLEAVRGTRPNVWAVAGQPVRAHRVR